MKPIVEIKDLTVDFQIRQGFFQEVIRRNKKMLKAVDAISLEVNTGEIVSLVGESGSGKTTTGRALLQLVHTTSGEALFDGEPIPTKGSGLKLFRKRAQMIFQDPYQSLNPKFMVMDIVAEPLQLTHQNIAPSEKERRVIEALEFAGLKPGRHFLYRYPHELSGGQRQRVSIATCFITDPEFIVADEPVSMLDASVRADILKLFVRMKQEKGISFIFITHDLSLAWLISDRIAIMYLGRIVETGPADLISGLCKHPYSQALTSVVATVGGTRKRKRIVLKGETPSPLDTPTGCAFHTRCPIAKSRCSAETPELRRIGPDHYVACHFPEPLV